MNNIIRCQELFITRSKVIKELAGDLESVKILADNVGFVKGFFFNKDNVDEAKILRERMKIHCEKNIEGFKYKWSYSPLPTTAANREDEPVKYTISIQTIQTPDKERKTFTAPYKVWDVRNTSPTVVWEEIKFFAEILDFIAFDTSYIFEEKPAVV